MKAVIQMRPTKDLVSHQVWLDEDPSLLKDHKHRVFCTAVCWQWGHLHCVGNQGRKPYEIQFYCLL